ncbi:hypothetical protein GGR50DRAFT_99256 [Xylaria sp. CBS 124048]|nr:hypothetical protein GGR50DRAFT_99256 [Xylaria sp. CBS 124048]
MNYSRSLPFPRSSVFATFVQGHTSVLVSSHLTDLVGFSLTGSVLSVLFSVLFCSVLFCSVLGFYIIQPTVGKCFLNILTHAHKSVSLPRQVSVKLFSSQLISWHFHPFPLCSSSLPFTSPLVFSPGHRTKRLKVGRVLLGSITNAPSLPKSRNT